MAKGGDGRYQNRKNRGEEGGKVWASRRPIRTRAVVHIPRISERDDILLHQIPQILDRRAEAAAVDRTRANRLEERARSVGEQALSVLFARDGRRHSRRRRRPRASCSRGCAGDNGAKDGLD
jgi:hypothetical protein